MSTPITARVAALEVQVEFLTSRWQQLLAPRPAERLQSIPAEPEAQKAPPLQMQQQAAPNLKEAQEACRQLGGEAASVVRRYLDSLPAKRVAERTAVADVVATMLGTLEITREEAQDIFERLRTPIYARWGSGEEGIVGHNPVQPVEMAQAVRSLLVEKLRQRVADWTERYAPVQGS